MKVRSCSNIVASQADLHRQFGGVVPEIASRRHLELIAPVIREALEAEAQRRLDRSPSPPGPGLIGALLVGVSAAKGLAWGRGLPLVPVNHLHGHVASLFLKPLDLEPPFTCLLASGGHTLLLDVQDRAWEGVPCWARRSTMQPARRSTRARACSACPIPEVPRSTGWRADGDPAAYDFPVARVPGLDFSFSGLKTALLYAVRDLTPVELEARRADLAASYQRAIVRALVERVEAAGGDRIAIVGGVAANSELRASLPDAFAAPLSLCTDNAAMIASAARYSDHVPADEYLALDAFASAS